MKRYINSVTKIIVILLIVPVILTCSCFVNRKPRTEDEYKEAFYQDKAVFEDARDKALQYEWTDENKKKGIAVFYKYTNQLEELEIRQSFLNKYRIVKIAVEAERGNPETLYVYFDMTDAIEGYRYSDIYYSPSGEPSSIELGEYREDIGMYYYKDNGSQSFECYTERLDDHWFLVKYDY